MARGIAVVAAIAAGVLAQSQPQPAFEVASVKPNKSEGTPGMDFGANGRFSARNVPLLFLVAAAYDVPFQGPRLTGLTTEAASQRYDVEATAEIPAGASALVRRAKMKLMLQTLLEERFKLKMRRETKVLPVYAVVIGKNGPKLRKAKIEEKDCPENAGDKSIRCHDFSGGMGRGLHADAINMTDLILAVSNWADRPVVDRTGLEGLFEINTEGWTRMQPLPPGGNDDEAKAFSDPTRPTLFMIFDRLGLKLESSTAAIEMFVVEHIEKPSEN